MRELILAGFDGNNNPSRTIVENVKCGCRKLILPNDREKSAELLLKEIEKESTACIVIIGQKPQICGKIAVERQAKRCGEVLRTSLDVTSAAELIKESGYPAYISQSCGNSYCNHIYFEALKTGVNSIFLHVPYMKNIPDMGALCSAVEGFVNGIAGVPAMLRA